ncbi:hypothetical protein B0H13DRAFT_2248161 [Mycena leptocephala]|nr:hypothetical protein B0H13DRAFT_2248161 [Mycena leptocephala]
MAPPDDNSWIPHGTHEVQIGPSLNKALKARKGGPPPQVKRTGPPEKDFYSFRYNFKPPSLDTTKPGTIELSRGEGATNVTLELPSSQPGENHVYTGNEGSAKELDCSYKLEKLESYIVLGYKHKTTTCTESRHDDETRLSTEIDAEGEIDDELPSHFPAREEEEEEGELEPVPVLPPPPPTKPAKAAPKPRPNPRPPAPQRKQTKKAPPVPPPPVPIEADGDADVEDLEFGRPATKRAKHTNAPPAPAPAPPVAFSLPGKAAPPPAPLSPVAVDDSDEDEDDWDEVAAAAPISVDVPQEIDMNEFELTLEAEMEAEMEEGLLADVLPHAPDSAVAPVRPMSLSQLAGYSDDEYSSSEESDDD